MAGILVTGDRYFNVDGKLHEITRQLRQRGGYPFEPDLLEQRLQDLVEGKFDVPHILETVTTAKVAGTERWTFMFPEEGRTDEEKMCGWFAHGLWIEEITPGFVSWLYGHTDVDVAPATLRVQKLRRSAYTGQVLAELGGTAETTLFHIFELLKAQGNCVTGPMDLGGFSGCKNIFYVPASQNLLFEVSVTGKYFGSRQGWIIDAQDARKTKTPIEKGCRVFSH